MIMNDKPKNKEKKIEDENGCFCNDGYHLDDDGNSRCIHCDRMIGTPQSRYWQTHDRKTMSAKDWEKYREIDWS